MRMLLVLACAVTVAAAAVPAPFKCHSEEFTKAKAKLEQLVLNKAQKEAIATYEATFRAEWAKTHTEKGCTHHEAHAAEFVAAAAGVLSDDQFKTFRGRDRKDAEKLQNEIWNTGVYIDNLLKLAKDL